VRSIVNKTHGAEGMLREFADERTDIAIAFIYGSYAKNTMNAASDIDLLLIITHKEIEDDLISGLSLIEEKLQREINYKIYTSTEFKRKRRNEDPFLSEIMSSDYIMLKGKI
jgi:predicted nucleotidyltransferase